jgi:hypothetical protein
LIGLSLFSLSFFSTCSRKMDECPLAWPLVDRLRCVLTYNGSAEHTTLNYTLIALTSAPFLLLVSRQSNGPKAAAMVVGSSSVFQVGLCLSMGCSGVSIVWCTLLGALLSSWRHQLSLEQRPLPLLMCGGAVVVDTIAIGFYAATTDSITTVAHLLAISMGVGLERLSSYLFVTRPTNNVVAKAGEDTGA